MFSKLIIVILINSFASADTKNLDILKLGKSLFFETHLSKNNTLSCGSCHQPNFAFTNGQRYSSGANGDEGDRNVPTLISRTHSKLQFWDGRADSLEKQAQEVLLNPKEMAGDKNAIIRWLTNDQKYFNNFKAVFGEAPTLKNLSVALASYIRSLSPGKSNYDLYNEGLLQAMTKDQLIGKDLFFNKFKCANCHSGAYFTNEKLRAPCYPATNLTPNTLVGQKFKVPTLRNLIYTAPYMHDGSLTTLEEVVEFYNPSFSVGKNGVIQLSSPIVRISADEKRSIVAFLKSLSAPQPYIENF